MKVGQLMPSFKGTDQDHNTVELSPEMGKPVVVFFYPKDSTPGCTKQACAFRDSYEDFQAEGATVLGVNSGSAESHRKFQENNRLPFPLLSDKSGKIRKLFGVNNDLFGLIPGRETFVFDGNGKLVYRFNSQFRFEDHAAEALKSLRKAVQKS